jgi:hypothetical protein
VARLLEINEYDQEMDSEYQNLTKLLDVTDVKRVGTNNEQLSVWKFLESNQNSAVFSLMSLKTSDSSVSKTISLNKLLINPRASEDILLVVRDLTPLIGLQQSSSKDHLNVISETIVRQIQESTEVSSLNLEKLWDHVKPEGRPISDDIQNELARVKNRISDFESVYNICEGSFESHQSNFSPKEELN